MKERQSSRTPFDPKKPVKQEDLQLILEAGSWAPTAHNMQNFEVLVVDDQELLREIMNIHYPVSPAFIQENYLQLSFSEDELKKKKVGVLSTLFPKSWLHPGLIPEHSGAEGDSHNRLLSCPMLVILLYNKSLRAPASEGDFLGIMSLGTVLENMWLMATKLGIGFHVVSALANEPAAAEIKTLLEVPAELSIGIAFRLGYPMANGDYLRVRRDVRDFFHSNRYGRREK